jgi:DNA ligase-1
MRRRSSWRTTKGRLGALLVQMADGTRFSVGTGFSDAVGVVEAFLARLSELTGGGVP